MKANYTVDSLVLKSDKCIEVCNFFDTNDVFNLGHQKIVFILKDKNSIGVWKIKNKKS